MSSLTPNFNLIKPDANDLFELFRQWYNDNLDIIDASLGGGASALAGLSDVNIASPTNGQLLGYNSTSQMWENVNGGGGGGHTIIDPLGQNMPSRTGLQFIGASVTDDSVNNKTVVNITGGGGGVHYSTTEQVIGTWIDGKPLYQNTVNVPNPVNDSNEHLVDLTSLSIGECPYLFGHAVRHSGANDITYYANSIETDGWYYFKARYDNFRGSIMYICLFRNDSISQMRFTIQYTKTTD